MNGRGEFQIGLDSREVDDQNCSMCQQPTRGSWLALEVRDSGHGIDAATLARIFEPFFTTKEVDKGSGMGLAIVHGHLVVTSTPGRSSTFCLLFPPSQTE